MIEVKVNAAPKLKFKVCTWYVPSPEREWWYPETFEEAMKIAWENKPALVMLVDSTDTFVGDIKVGEKEYKDWIKSL